MSNDAPASPMPQPGKLLNRGLIDGFSVTAEGKATPVTTPGQEPPEGGFIWLHLNVGEAGELVEDMLKLDPMVARSLLATETRPRCQHLREGILLNLRGVNLNEGRRPEDMLSVRCFLQPRRLITVRMQRSLAIEELRKEYHAGQGHERPGALLLDIISRLVTLIDPVIDGIADSMDGFEQRAMEEIGCEALKDTVAALRHDAVTYRRYLDPMHHAVAKLASKETPSMTIDDLEMAQEEADRVLRIVEELDITIDRAGVIVDQLDAARSDKINRNMMLLSVMSAVFLPLGFLTGLLGINVGGLPGVDNPHAFLWVVGICLVISFLAGVYFKARDWI